MRQRYAFITMPRLLRALLTLAVALAGAPAAMAQKVTEQPVWAMYHKAPMVLLAPRYKSYSVEYDLGPMAAPTTPPPALQRLEVKESGGDLTLKIAVAPPTITDKVLMESVGAYNGRSRPQYSYQVQYAGKHGYTLLDQATKTPVAAYEESQGSFVTENFDSVKDLDNYVKNTLQPALARKVLDQLLKRISFELADNNWQARVTIHSVEGSTPAYKEINTATSDFIATLAVALPDVQRLRPLTAVWEAQLANVKWGEKRAEINQKVGLALLENLCAAYLLLEDYGAIKEKAALFDSQNTNPVVAKQAPAFEVEQDYTGAGTGPHMLPKDGRTNFFVFVPYKADLSGRRMPGN